MFKNSVHGWLGNGKLILPDWYVKERGLNTNIVDREHLKELVRETESDDTSYSLVGRLSKSDVDFSKPMSNVDKMKVPNATKYFNYNVAAALNVVAETTGKLELKATAAYISDVTRWYDLMNSREDSFALSPSRKEKYETSLNHITFASRLLGSVIVGKDGHFKPWQAAAVMASNAVLRLQNFFFKECEYTTLFTSRFVQDCLENLFSMVRLKQKRPTALQMKQHLRTIALSQFMMVPQNTSYDVDDRDFFSSFVDLIRQKKNVERNKDPFYINPGVVVCTEEAITLKNVAISKILEISREFIAKSDGNKLNAMYHVCREMITNQITCSKLCDNCYFSWTDEAPFHPDIAKYALSIDSVNRFPSEAFFNYFVLLNFFCSLYNNLPQPLASDVTMNKLRKIPFSSELLDCHHLSQLIIERVIKYRISTEGIRKIRKTKYDSRSMVV